MPHGGKNSKKGSNCALSRFNWRCVQRRSGRSDTTSHILKLKALEQSSFNWRLNVSKTTVKRPVFIDWLALEQANSFYPQRLAAPTQYRKPNWFCTALAMG